MNKVTVKPTEHATGKDFYVWSIHQVYISIDHDADIKVILQCCFISLSMYFISICTKSCRYIGLNNTNELGRRRCRISQRCEMPMQAM